MSARETAELLLLVGRLVQAEGYDGELSPAQWMALRFFARANSFSRTPSAFAEFQATTRGTASQAIKALETGGYLVRQRSEADGRSVSLRLTDKGHEAVARDPFEVLVRAVDSLDAEEQTAMHHALHQVLTTVAASGRASALRCLPGLRVPRWRNLLQLNERDPLGPQMPTVRRSDRAGGRWSPLRPFSAKERAPRGRTDTMNEFTHCDLLKGRLIDLRRQRELHSLQNHGLRRRVPRGLLLRGREHARHPPGRMHRLRGLRAGMPGRRDQARHRAGA